MNTGVGSIIQPLTQSSKRKCGVRRWTVTTRGKWILYIAPGATSRVPAPVLRHLRAYKNRLEQRANTQKWYELQQPQERYIPIFEGPKILYQEIATYQNFAFDSTGVYVNGKVFMLPGDDLYLLAILNSAPAWEYLSQVCGKLVGGALAMQAIYLSKLPIPNAAPEEKSGLAELAKKCIDNVDDPRCEQWQQDIDERAYRLYRLDPSSTLVLANRHRPISNGRHADAAEE
jgi:TaqI-like C-terminal specificity domain